jgi:uncharacterized protein (TIGR03382 family)
MTSPRGESTCSTVTLPFVLAVLVWWRRRRE